MIENLKGDIFRCDAEAVVNTVNCVGVMGRGIALQFRKAFPENFKAYKSACDRDEIQPGIMFVFETRQMDAPHYIINFPTKKHWKGKSAIADIESGLKSLVKEIHSRNIQSIAIPPLGCGLGGLLWSDVKPLIVAAFEGVENVHVKLFEPASAPPPSQMIKAEQNPL